MSYTRSLSDCAGKTSRACWQMLAPPHSLHWLLIRACWQMLAPPHSLPCSFADCAGRCSPLHVPCTGTFCAHTSPTAPLVLAFPLRFSSASSMASLAAEAPPAHPCSTLVHSPLALAAAANCRHLLARPDHPVTPHLPRPRRCRRRVPCTATPHPLSVQLPPQHISPLLSDQ